MGFFKDIGNAISNGVKEAVKVVSVKNAVNLVTGNVSAVVKDAIDRGKNAGLQVVAGVGTATGLIKVPATSSGVASVGVASGGGVSIKTGSALAGVKASFTPVKQQFAVAQSTKFANLPVATKEKSVAGEILTALVEDWVDDQGNKISKGVNRFWDSKLGKVVEKIGEKFVEVPVGKSFMDRLSKVALKYYWEKYKTWFIIGGLALVGGLVWWFKFRKPRRGRRTR